MKPRRHIMDYLGPHKNIITTYIPTYAETFNKMVKYFKGRDVEGFLPWVPLLPNNHQHAFHGNDGTSFLVGTSI